jgi:hypothetical protein
MPERPSQKKSDQKQPQFKLKRLMGSAPSGSKNSGKNTEASSTTTPSASSTTGKKPKTDETPRHLKPYLHNGVDFNNLTGKEAIADCPFCGEENKFSVSIEKGTWRCFVCDAGNGGNGNALVFIRELYTRSLAQTSFKQLAALAERRGFMSAQPLAQWGVCRNVLNGDWLIPGFAKSGQLSQLYRYDTRASKPRVMATADMDHQLFGLNLFNKDCSEVHLLEGPWDPMALWEVLLHLDDLEDTGILAVPGVNSFNPIWCDLFADKVVNIWFDNDYPKQSESGREIPPASHTGMKRIAAMLNASTKKPTAINFLKWGEDGYDPTLDAGTDVNDLMRACADVEGRVKVYYDLNDRVKPIPDDWMDENVLLNSVEPVGCSDFNRLREAWTQAMSWTTGLETSLVVMLAAAASTNLIGDQLWVKIIGPASCGKSTLCEAVSVSKKYILAKSTLRGFHSGFSPNTGKDTSLVSQCKGKTLITKDGDTLLQQPNLSQILAEARDVYDTVSRTSYRNQASRNYEGLRMTWILCGTKSLRSIDSSELGERFLDCVLMEEIDDDLEDEILMMVARGQQRVMSREADEQVASNYSPELLRAMQLTGGYVEYLREHASELMSQVSMADSRLRLITRYAKFVAYVRARPSKLQDEEQEREFGARLTKQHLRMAYCVAIALGRNEVDADVMRVVRKVCLDTARGTTLELIRSLYDQPGQDTNVLSLTCNIKETTVRSLLTFMCSIGITERYRKKDAGKTGRPLYRLTDKMVRLYDEVVNEPVLDE